MKNWLRDRIIADRSLTVLFCLLIALLFIGYPIFGHMPAISVVLDVLFSLTLLVAAAAVVPARGPWGWVLALFAALAIVGQWFSAVLPSPADAVLIVVFLGFAIAGLLSRTFEDGPVTVHRISGALSAYVLLGLAWAFIYAIIEENAPGSFNVGAIPLDDVVGRARCMLYFSYVTLTTLGYGDITPISQPARSLALLEALTGQIYLVVLVARLVSLHVTRPSSDDN